LPNNLTKILHHDVGLVSPTYCFGSFLFCLGLSAVRKSVVLLTKGAAAPAEIRFCVQQKKRNERKS
jgi:hypothetical protein